MNREVYEDSWVQHKGRAKQALDRFADDHLEVIARKRGQLDKRIQHTYARDDDRIKAKIPSFEARHRY